MNTLMIASFTSLLSISAVAEPLVTETFTTPTLATEIQTDIQQYATQLAEETALHAHQALFATGLSLLSNIENDAKQDMEYLVQHMMLLAKKLAASSLKAE